MENSDRFKLRDKPPPGMEMLADGKVLYQLHREVCEKGHRNAGIKKLILTDDLDSSFKVSVRISENVNNRAITVIGPGGRNEKDPGFIFYFVDYLDLITAFVTWDKRVGIVEIPFSGFALVSLSRVSHLKDLTEILNELYHREGITSWEQLENKPKLDARLHDQASKRLGVKKSLASHQSTPYRIIR